jgi:tRNA-specific 2-thiouridylase
MLQTKNKTVYVGLSGGVDSSVSAYLLKSQGYNVIGVFIRGWQPSWLPCTWKEDRISAMRTAAYLDIPFKTLDLEKEYKEKIVDYMLDEYANGRTPNGDMLCNREIKFGLFLKYAIENGADFVATGHYARTKMKTLSLTLSKGEGTEQQALNKIKKIKKNEQIEYKLFEAENKEKDQSYFLSQITQEQLKYILFPLGNFKSKSEIRKIAEENNLPVATRKDSQGMCFVGDITMKDFLKNELCDHKNLQIGKILNEKGEEIGEHEGVILYTVGERHGFKLYKNFQTTENKSLYVIGKDLEKNILIVSEDKTTPTRSQSSLPSPKGRAHELENSIRKSEVVKLEKISFINSPLKINEILQIRVRYRGEKINVKVIKINLENKTCELEILDDNFKNIKVAEGQFGVFYKGEECLGGGVFI